MTGILMTTYLGGAGTKYWITQLSGLGAINNQGNQPTGLYVDSSDNIYFGTYYSTNTGSAIIKITDTPTLSLSKGVTSSGSNRAINYIRTDTSGNIYYSSDQASGPAGIRGVKLSSSGTLTWSTANAFAGFGAINSSFAHSSLGVYTTTPSTYSYTYDANGTYVSRYLDTTTFTSSVFSATSDTSGNFYFVASTGTSQTSILKLNSSGVPQLGRVFSVNNSANTIGSISQSINIDTSGNMYVINNTNTFAKLNSSATLQWTRLFSVGNLTGITTDPLGNVYVIGYAGTTPSTPVVAKYNSSGTIQWQRSFADATNNVRPYSVFATSKALYIGVTSGTTTSGIPTILKLPLDGSLTGNYTDGSYTYVYTSSAYTDAAGSGTWSSIGLPSSSSTAGSTNNPTISSVTPTLTTKAIN